MTRTALAVPLGLLLAGACVAPGGLHTTSPDEPVVVEVLVGGVT